MRKHRTYQPKPVRIPMTGLRDTIALHMHASLAALTYGADTRSFDSLANIINMVGLTIQHDDRCAHEYRLVQGGAMAMNDIGKLIDAGLRPQEHHLAPVRVAVNAIDNVLGWIDVAKLYTAEKLAVAAVRHMREQRKSQ
ncbi:hypothetical protein ACMHYO_16355 [Allopusillimonas ginsengisoli]|uniref:hypothetical protein n=1 Tax=Allopusillimonas ginsengisoli TaxID=453575 RepID=UPI0039C0A29C